MVNMLEVFQIRLLELTPFNRASAYELPLQVAVGYAVTTTSMGKVFHLHGN